MGPGIVKNSSTKMSKAGGFPISVFNDPSDMEVGNDAGAIGKEWRNQNLVWSNENFIKIPRQIDRAKTEFSTNDNVIIRSGKNEPGIFHCIIHNSDLK